MTNTNGYEDLGKRIERLVAEHIAESRRAAQDAVERAFAVAVGVPGSPSRRSKSTDVSHRRASTDVAALAERFYRAVCAKPGETMTVLGPEVGASARELHRSVTLLRREGRVRAVGHRRFMRYFPMANGAAVSE